MFNSPYATASFPKYAERIAFDKGTVYELATSESESVRALSEAAKAAGVWLVGGEWDDGCASYEDSDSRYSGRRVYPRARCGRQDLQLVADVLTRRRARRATPQGAVLAYPVEQGTNS